MVQKLHQVSTADFLTDGLGSTILLTNSLGGSIAQYAYEPFGKATVTSGSSTNEFQYTGRENDATGLYFNRARYYHPGIQRFVSEDPIGWRGGTNLSVYAANAPTSFTDPTGLKPNEHDLTCLLFLAAFDYAGVALLPISGSDTIGQVLGDVGAAVGLACPVPLTSKTCEKTSMAFSLGGAAFGAIANHIQIGAELSEGGDLGQYGALVTEIAPTVTATGRLITLGTASNDAVCVMTSFGRAE